MRCEVRVVKEKVWGVLWEMWMAGVMSEVSSMQCEALDEDGKV